MKGTVKNIIFVVALCLLLVAGGLYVIPGLMGWKSLAVKSASMSPKIPTGSLVVVKPMDSAEYQLGDVITYRLGSETYVTHRILEIDAESGRVVTKGDANNVPDNSPVSFTDIVGRVVLSVPILGYVSIYGNTSVGRAVICAMVFALVMWAVLPGLFIQDGSGRKDKEQVNQTENNDEQE